MSELPDLTNIQWPDIQLPPPEPQGMYYFCAGEVYYCENIHDKPLLWKRVDVGPVDYA